MRSSHCCWAHGSPALAGDAAKRGPHKPRRVDGHEGRGPVASKGVDPPPFDVIDTIAFMERTQVYLSVLVTHRHGLTEAEGRSLLTPFDENASNE
jgi:hypothetical protein